VSSIHAAPERWSYEMSTAEIERFAADIHSNAALRAEAEKSQAEKSHAPPLDRFVAFAASKGYAITIDEAKQHVQAKATAEAAAKGKVLTDSQLDGIAGGDWLGDAMGAMFCAAWCYNT
jgi:hypothetical protein